MLCADAGVENDKWCPKVNKILPIQDTHLHLIQTN